MPSKKSLNLGAVAKIAEKVRAKLERYAARFFFPDDLTGLCAIGSVGLARSLRHENIAAFVASGYYGKQLLHCWVLVEDFIVDITATQFGVPDTIFIACLNSEETIKYWRNPKILNISKCFHFFSDWEDQAPTPQRLRLIEIRQ